MSKIFIISNTNFNISKGLSHKEWQDNIMDYFNNEFIPYLTDNVQPNDILVHLGNLTHKTKTIDLNTLKIIQDTFEKISNILPVYMIEGENDNLPLNILKNFKKIHIINKPTLVNILPDQIFSMLPINTKFEELNKIKGGYCFLNFDYMNSKNKDIIINKLKNFNKCYNGFYSNNSVVKNIKNIASPYNINTDGKRGIIVLDTHTNKDKFILNKTSPSFKNINIDTVEDLDIPQEKLKNNYVSLNINKDVLIDNKLKIDMLMAENNIVNVIYSDDEIMKDKEDILELNQEKISLNEMVIDYINNSQVKNKDELLKEFNNIIKLNIKK